MTKKTELKLRKLIREQLKKELNENLSSKVNNFTGEMETMYENFLDEIVTMEYVTMDDKKYEKTLAKAQTFLNKFFSELKNIN